MSALCGAHHPLESSHGCYEDAGDHTTHVSCTVALGGWHDELTWTVVGHDWAAWVVDASTVGQFHR